MTDGKVTLPKLDYGYADLEPVLSEQLLTLHHTKHHQNYVDTYNKLLDEFTEAKNKNDVYKIVSLTPGLKFNLGSHINHSIYWKNLCPIKNGGGKVPENSKLVEKIKSQWGSVDKFIADFIDNIMKIQGSGWGNLAYNKTTKCLEYLETKDQDPVALKSNYVAILCVDGWEHAWYVKYLNMKKTYYTEIWKIVNWDDLEKRYLEATK
jgi:Fe-Mn family superoxide dismutase